MLMVAVLSMQRSELCSSKSPSEDHTQREIKDNGVASIDLSCPR